MSSIDPRLQAELDLTRSSIPEDDPDSPPLVTFTLKGKRAIAFLLLVAGPFVWNAVDTRALSPEEQSAIERHLRIRYTGEVLTATRIAAATSPDARRALMARADSAQRITVASGRAKGLWGSAVVRVRAEWPDGRSPTGDGPVYLKLSCLTGCRVAREIWRVSYTLGLWFIDPR